MQLQKPRSLIRRFVRLEFDPKRFYLMNESGEISSLDLFNRVQSR